MTDKRLLHTAHIPVRWGDMDNYGHVNNTVYLEYVQEARVAWFASVGIASNGTRSGSQPAPGRSAGIGIRPFPTRRFGIWPVS